MSTQAAGALLNLASDSSEYAKQIVSNGAVPSLVNLVKDGPDLAKEYSAGALMNLMRGDMEVANNAAKQGAIPSLANLLSRPSGTYVWYMLDLGNHPDRLIPFKIPEHERFSTLRSKNMCTVKYSEILLKFADSTNSMAFAM